MEPIFRKRPIRYPLAGISAVGLLASVALLTINIWLGIVVSALFIVLLSFVWRAEEQTYVQTEKYIVSLSHRVERAGDEALQQLPIGIILFDEYRQVDWANEFAASIFERSSLIGESLDELSDALTTFVKKSDDTQSKVLTIGDCYYEIQYRPNERLLYLFDVTEQVTVRSLYEKDRTVLGVLLIDNYDELAQRMDDKTKSQMNSHVTSLLNDWAKQNGIFMKRIAQDRFFIVLNDATLAQLEETNFSILDVVRERTAEQTSGLTLSIGIGTGSTELIELGDLAQASLDLVLGRGGDQVAIKHIDGKLKFFGGKTNPVEKRTRVRARVISHALRDLIQGSDQVFVMGHKMPDMDAVGASIGVRKMALMNKTPGYVVMNFDELDPSVTRLMKEIEQDHQLFEHFITPEQALEKMTDRSLVVVVDTHKPSMVIDERVLEASEKVVLIDHHRRSEEFIDQSMLVYMEPYASSTAELVTELIEYQPKHEKLTMLEATSMLAGIVVDTKSFTLRTGSRTFEAASYLRMHGADTVLVQQLLKEDIDTYMERAKLIDGVTVLDHGIAIAKGEEGRVYGPVLIAQTADILLSMLGISASFVIAPRKDGKIGISARSLGEINVQRVMEELGGGGHLTNAACQLPVDSVEEAEQKLLAVLEKREESEGGNDS